MKLDKTEIERTVHIQANFPQTIEFNLDNICENFGIDKNDIVELNVIPWGILSIKTKDGNVLEVEGWQSEDWKHPISTTYFAEGYNEIVEIDN